jgi:hypothetical protein
MGDAVGALDEKERDTCVGEALERQRDVGTRQCGNVPRTRRHGVTRR